MAYLECFQPPSQDGATVERQTTTGGNSTAGLESPEVQQKVYLQTAHLLILSTKHTPYVILFLDRHSVLDPLQYFALHKFHHFLTLILIVVTQVL